MTKTINMYQNLRVFFNVKNLRSSTRMSVQTHFFSKRLGGDRHTDGFALFTSEGGGAESVGSLSFDWYENNCQDINTASSIVS